MLTVESKLRNWGRSIGVVIPKEAIIKENLKEGETIKLVIMKKSSIVRETFGKLKLKRSTDEILREIDEEGWNE